MTDAPGPHDELLAAELAFGLLDPPERAAAEARAATEPAFAARCARWRSHAAGLTDEPGERPDPAVWAAILGRLPANDDAQAVALRRSVRAWRGASAALALVALFAVAMTLRHPEPPTLAPSIAAKAPRVVLLTGAHDVGVAAISYDRATGRVATVASALAIGPRAAELWVIPAGGDPHSLGVINAAAATDRIAPADIRALIVPGATLAISVEPAGGSPTGQPTGPVILSGKVTTG